MRLRADARTASPQRPPAARPLGIRVWRRRRGQCPCHGHGRGPVARRAGQRRGGGYRRPAGRRDRRLRPAASRGQRRRRPHHADPPRPAAPRRAGWAHGLSYSSGWGRFDRLSLDVIEHAAENLARFAEQPQYRTLATVAWGARLGIAPEDSFAAQIRGLLRARAAGQTGVVARGSARADQSSTR